LHGRHILYTCKIARMQNKTATSKTICNKYADFDEFSALEYHLEKKNIVAWSLIFTNSNPIICTDIFFLGYANLSLNKVFKKFIPFLLHNKSTPNRIFLMILFLVNQLSTYE